MLSSVQWVERLNGLGSSLGLSVYDLELPQGPSGTFRVFLWPASRTEQSKAVSLEECIEFARLMRTLPELRALEEAGAGLEVSSPGVNRKLRTAQHFQSAVGEHVAVKVYLPDGSAKKVRGEIEDFSAPSEEITLLLDAQETSAPGVKKQREKKKKSVESVLGGDREVISFPLSDVVEARVEYVFRSNRK